MPWLLKMTLYTALILLVIDIYLVWRGIHALTYLNLPYSAVWKGLTIGLFALFFTYPLSGLVQYLSGNEVDLLQFPKPLIYYYWFGFAFSFQLVTWILILDILKVITNFGFGINAPFIDRGYGWLVISVTILVITYSGVKLYLDTTRITTEHTRWNHPENPGSLSSFRLVHISDIQGDTFTSESKIERYVQKVNSLEADLVIFTGDLISYGTRKIEMSAQKMGEITAKYGVYAVIGDHDYWAGSQHVIEALANQNIQVLTDENTTIAINSDTIRITGITEVYSKRAIAEEVQRLTSETDHSMTKIMASHQISPLLLDEAKRNNYHILLAGHTHGGQLRVPFLFRYFSASDLETRYVNGTYKEDRLLINVNSGLGFTLAPVRYNAPASISVIEFR